MSHIFSHQMNVLTITITRKYHVVIDDLMGGFRSSSPPHDLNTFVNEQQAILNGIHMNLSKSPVGNLEVRYKTLPTNRSNDISFTGTKSSICSND